MAAVPSTPAAYMAHDVEIDTPWKGFHPGNHHFEAVPPVKLEGAFEVVADPVVSKKRSTPKKRISVSKRSGVSKRRASTPPNQGIPKKGCPPAPKKRSTEHHGGFGNAPVAIQLFP